MPLRHGYLLHLGKGRTIRKGQVGAADHVDAGRQKRWTIKTPSPVTSQTVREVAGGMRSVREVENDVDSAVLLACLRAGVVVDSSRRAEALDTQARRINVEVLHQMVRDSLGALA